MVFNETRKASSTVSSNCTEFGGWRIFLCSGVFPRCPYAEKELTDLKKKSFLTVCLVWWSQYLFHFEPGPPIKLMHCFLSIDELKVCPVRLLEDGLYIRSACDKLGHNIFALLTWRSEVNSSLPTECGLALWLLNNRTQWKQGQFPGRGLKRSVASTSCFLSHPLEDLSHSAKRLMTRRPCRKG